MCSLDDENCESLNLTENPSVDEKATCRSCTNTGQLVLRKKDVYCKNCFLAAVTHKFRAALGKSKLMKPQDRVLVAYSGSQSSAVLLNLLNSGVREEQHKKLLFNVFVLFIDEGALLNMKIDERKKLVKEIKKGVSVYDFPFFVSSLAEFFKESPCVESTLKIDEESDKKLVDLFENIKSFSSKEDMLNLVRQKLVLKAAEQLGCNKIFTAEVGNDMAVKLLSGFSLGRGATAAFETSFCDSRHPAIKFIRPLRDFTKKEVVFYQKFKSIEIVTIPSITTKSSSNVSIQKLIEKFITNLQEEFPSTVYTVFRTAEKLDSSTLDEEINEGVCILCKDKIRTHKSRNNYTAVKAAEFSRNVSRKKSNSCEIEKDGCCGSCLCEKKVNIESVDLEKFMCYGCALIIRDMKTVDVLPKDVLQAAIEKRNFEAMEEQISEFLIENSSEVEV